MMKKYYVLMKKSLEIEEEGEGCGYVLFRPNPNINKVTCRKKITKEL